MALAVSAARQLQAEGIQTRVVSMPSTTLFDLQPPAYRAEVLPDALRARVAIEAGTSDFWRKYVGLDGRVIGLDRFGESAPGDQLMTHFGFTVDNIVSAVREVIA